MQTATKSQSSNSNVVFFSFNAILIPIGKNVVNKGKHHNFLRSAHIDLRSFTFGDWIRCDQTDVENLLAGGGKTARLTESDLNKALHPFPAWRPALRCPGVRAHDHTHTPQPQLHPP